MEEKKRLTTTEVARELGVCKQRVAAKLNQGHYPNASRCECGLSMMIPREDVDLDIKHRGQKGKR
jgi:hypothetical protein